MFEAASWEPDKGPFNEGTTDYVMNVTPIANGYGPFPDLSSISAALGSQCFGGCYYRNSSGSYGVVAGTFDRLYRMDTSASPYTWTDVSGASAPYAVPTGQMWQFERNGTQLFACSIGAPLQQLDVDAGVTFIDTPGSPPRSKYIKTIGDFLVLGYLKVGGQEYPSKWTTSSINNTSAWTVGVDLADEQVIPDGDEIMGLLGGIGGGAVIQRRAKRSLDLSPDVAMPIKSTVIDPAYGAVAPLSIVQIGVGDYLYLAEDGFMRGHQRINIGGEKVNRTFMATVNLDRLEEVQGINDPFNHIAWWRYQDTTNAYRMIGYDWELDKWVQSDVAVSVLIPVVTAAVTLEALDAIFLALYGSSSIDVAGAESFDSRRWAGGRPIFAGINSSDFTLGLFTGLPRAASVDTTAKVLSQDLFRNAGVTGAYAVCDTNSYSIAKAGALKHGDVSTLAYGTASTASSRTGICPLRGDHKIARFRWQTAAGVDWSFFHGVEVQSFPTGAG